MSNDISSLLQPFAPQVKVPGQVHGNSRVPGQAQDLLARSTSQPAMSEKPAASLSDRVTLTDSASQLHKAESKPGQVSLLRLDSSDVGMTYGRTGNGVRSASELPSVEGNAQRPTPAMANMMEAFLTTSDMEGFDTSSDLNADGVINFQDLAALRDLESGVGVEPSENENPKDLMHNMTGSFLRSEGEKGFDAASDLNADGVINFLDLAALRDIETGAGIEPSENEKPVDLLHNMTGSFGLPSLY